MKTKKIFGPPGTGKTHALLDIVERMIRAGVKVERIAYITFTTRAQKEAIGRAQKLLNRPINELPYFRTLHSIAYRQLQINRSQLLTDTKLLEPLAKALHLEFKGSSPSPEGRYDFISADDGDALLAFDHYRRHTGLSIEKAWFRWALESDANIFRVRQFVSEYERFKRNDGLLDFTDLLNAELKPLDVDVVIVDEAQDLSELQWKALRRLAARAKRLYVAGDDDQAIYNWAGASADAFLSLKADATEVLGQSYRVPPEIQRLANEIVSPIRNRQSKQWKPRESKGIVNRSNDVENLLAKLSGTDEDTLILYRNHHFGKNVEKLLRTVGAPYTYADVDHVPYVRKWIPAIIAWQRLWSGKSINTASVRAIASAITARNGITTDAKKLLEGVVTEGEWTLEQLREAGVSATGPWYEALTKIPSYDVQYVRSILRHHGNDGLLKTPNIRISTIHAAKGAEAKHVVLMLDMTQKVTKSLWDNPDDERRVWYVGVTRAKERITLVGHHHPFISI